MQVIIDLGHKVNTIYLDFGEKLGLHIKNINVGVQGINGSNLDIFDIVIACFLIENKYKKV